MKRGVLTVVCTAVLLAGAAFVNSSLGQEEEEARETKEKITVRGTVTVSRDGEGNIEAAQVTTDRDEIYDIELDKRSGKLVGKMEGKEVAVTGTVSEDDEGKRLKLASCKEVKTVTGTVSVKRNEKGKITEVKLIASEDEIYNIQLDKKGRKLGEETDNQKVKATGTVTEGRQPKWLKVLEYGELENRNLGDREKEQEEGQRLDEAAEEVKPKKIIVVGMVTVFRDGEDTIASVRLTTNKDVVYVVELDKRGKKLGKELEGKEAAVTGIVTEDDEVRWLKAFEYEEIKKKEVKGKEGEDEFIDWD